MSPNVEPANEATKRLEMLDRWHELAPLVLEAETSEPNELELEFERVEIGGIIYDNFNVSYDKLGRLEGFSTRRVTEQPRKVTSVEVTLVREELISFYLNEDNSLTVRGWDRIVGKHADDYISGQVDLRESHHNYEVDEKLDAEEQNLLEDGAAVIAKLLERKVEPETETWRKVEQDWEIVHNAIAQIGKRVGPQRLECIGFRVKDAVFDKIVIFTDASGRDPERIMLICKRRPFQPPDSTFWEKPEWRFCYWIIPSEQLAELDIEVSEDVFDNDRKLTDSAPFTSEYTFQSGENVPDWVMSVLAKAAALMPGVVGKKPLPNNDVW